MKEIKTLAVGLLLSIIFHPSTHARFTDFLQLPSWSEGAVDIVQKRKIMTGFGDGTFRPDKELNRAEALTILLRSKSIDTKNIVGRSPFKDVPRDAWFANAVIEATRQGWIKGFPDGTFRPGKVLNNAEWATLVSRAFGLEREDSVSFTDVPSKAWFAKPIRHLKANELIRRKSARTFNPELSVTRAEAAWMMAEIVQKPRLMGTSSSNQFTESRRVTSRRTAIKPRDFNPNKQGYDVEKKEISINAEPKPDAITLSKTSDWQYLGQTRIKNNTDDRAELHSIELELRFDADNIGPVSNFHLKIESQNQIWEKRLNRNGEALFGGLKISILNGTTKSFRVYIRPETNESFYSKSGDGHVAIVSADGSMISTFKSDSVNNQTGFRSAPIRVQDRKLTEIKFQP